ncbi:MAG: tetratricopeptide repeat protein [Candidatus Firestonebacteria bacterium]|nr:tetratricopeptide repeat protein [Candidatus Firestonebacteria bacterium]
MLKIVNLFCLIIIASLSAGDSSVPYTRALELFNNRHLEKDNALKAKEITVQLLEAEPENVKALVLIARYYMFAGERLEKEEEKRTTYEKSVEYAKKALKLDEKSPDAHFYHAAALGRCAQLKGIFNAIGSAGEIKKEFERTLELDPKHPIAKIALANYFYQVPGFFGGSTEKAIELLKESMETHPNLTMAYVDMARIYKNQGKKKEAKELLQKVIENQTPAIAANFYLYDKKEAEALLKELEK